jgi:hypothetical protein
VADWRGSVQHPRTDARGNFAPQKIGRFNVKEIERGRMSGASVESACELGAPSKTSDAGKTSRLQVLTICAG